MKYFIDTEFIYTTGTVGSGIDPLSIGVVAEDGRELYLVNWPALEYKTPDTLAGFLWEHVIPVLDNTQDNMTDLAGMAIALKDFIGDDTPQFIGEYSAFDYVVLSTIMGGFENWPKGWPMYIRDLVQESVPEGSSTTPHNALADARAVRDDYTHAYAETYPPVSDGELDMDSDETACGALCQDLNDRMWDKLGPVDEVELPF